MGCHSEEMRYSYGIVQLSAILNLSSGDPIFVNKMRLCLTWDRNVKIISHLEYYMVQ